MPGPLGIGLLELLIESAEEGQPDRGPREAVQVLHLETTAGAGVVPGCVARMPFAQSGHSAGAYEGMSRRQREWTGTSRRAAPPDRSTRTEAPTTAPPAERTPLAEHSLDIARTDGHHDYSARVKIHDVSLVLRPDMVTWPGEPAPRIEPLKRIARGDSNNVSIITLGDHTGTHVDPPLHFIEGGNTVDKLPLDALVGPCRVIAFEGQGHISGDWLDGAKIPKDEDRPLFKTPNSARWSDATAPFTRDFNTLNASAAKWCVDHNVKLVGIDYLSIEPQGPEKAGYPVHNTLLRAGVVIVETLDLRGIEPGEYELVCAPLKIKDGDGAPARVFLIER